MIIEMIIFYLLQISCDTFIGSMEVLIPMSGKNDALNTMVAARRQYY